MKQTWIAGILILACLMIGGCGTESDRLANLANRTIEMQSQQNSTIAKTTNEMVELNREIQLERKELTQGHKQLEAALNVVPVSTTAGESVERLRKWASGRCLDAEKGGIYRYKKGKSTRRKVSRDPSLN